MARWERNKKVRQIPENSAQNLATSHQPTENVDYIHYTKKQTN